MKHVLKHVFLATLAELASQYWRAGSRIADVSCRGYSWWGVGNRNFFFLIPAPAQLSAYANHEFKIIPTPTQLSAYANHELNN